MRRRWRVGVDYGEALAGLAGEGRAMCLVVVGRAPRFGGRAAGVAAGARPGGGRRRGRHGGAG
ncbi:MAG: hypothetical protein WDM92_00100 [Caulobacteraceae bacterium]